MSIAVVAQVERRLGRGYDDPGLPIGVWQVSQLSTGDASGGQNIVQFNLKAAGTQFGNLYSLEQLTVDDQEVAHVAFALVNFAGMEVFGPGNRQRQFSVPTHIPSGTGDLIGEAFQPGFIIGRAAGSVAAGTIVISVENTDTRELIVTAMGYMWTPRSLLQTSGGMRRPIEGLFPH